jgi:hypothetical protein
MKINCCNSPYLNKKSTDLGHVGSFEFVLKQCVNCGACWMDVFCIPTNTTGFEPVTKEEAKLMMSMAGSESKKILKSWFNDK